MTDDSALISRFNAGDMLAFDTLVERYRSRVFGQIHKWPRLVSQADDVAQEVWINVFKGLPSFDPAKGAFDHWLCRIVTFRCCGFLKRHEKHSNEIPYGELNPHDERE